MTIVITCDIAYFEKADPLWKSLQKNWKGRVCILCVGFIIPNTDDGKWNGFEHIYCSIEEFKCYRKDWPSNRPVYFCSESGEFLDYFKFESNELIIHLDADMIMQREMSLSEQFTFGHIEEGEVAMSPYSNPPCNLREEVYKLNQRKGYEKINNDFPGKLGSMPCFCSGLVAARKETWEQLRDEYVKRIDDIVSCFDHHAASQWLMNYILYNDIRFNLIELDSVTHNAAWFIDTGAVDGDQLKYREMGQEDKVVLFNHTKFAKEYKY